MTELTNMATKAASTSTHSTTSVGQENLLKRLIKAYNEDNLTLFIGAGISKCVVDSKAMLWSEAVLRMQEILKIKESDPLRLAQLFYQQYPEQYVEFAHSMIDTTAHPSAVHMMIAQLHPKVIITTNWDNLIEQSVIDSLMYYDVITCDEELLLSKSPYKIIKMHGDFARNDERFVFKEDDYLNYSQNYPLIETFLKNILITSNVLFLGYSYSDINLKLIMTWLKQNKKTANSPLYVITEFIRDQSQIKYLQNWGVETYICENISEKSKNLNLPENDQDRSRKIYTLLEYIYFNISNPNDILSSLINKIEPYKDLQAISFVLVTSLFKESSIKCDEYGNPILNIIYTSDDTYTSRLIDQIKTEKNSTNVKKFKSFLQKSGIVNIIVINLSNTKDPSYYLFEQEHENLRYLDDVSDINDYLSFRNISFDRHYDIIHHNQLIRESLKNGNISIAFIEIFNLNIHKLFLYPHIKDDKTKRIKIDDVLKNLPGNLKTIYQTFVSSIRFDDIKEKTKKLYESIETKTTQIKKQTKVLFNDSDLFLSRSEHLNFLRFAWLNHLCIDYYTEVKDYIYHSILLLNLTLLYHKIPLHLKRFELSSILHFIDKHQINNIFSRETYPSENEPLEIALAEEDILWLIDEVFPNLMILYKTQEKNPFIDNNWTTKIGYAFIILAYVQQFTKKSINEIMNFIINCDAILKDPYNLLDPIIVFLEKQHDIIKSCTKLPNFIYEIKRIFIDFLHKSQITHPHYEKISNDLSNILMIFSEDINILIDDINFINDFLSQYFQLNWINKCNLFSSLNTILALAPKATKKKLISKLKRNIKKENNPPIAYYIYYSLLIIINIFIPSIELFKEIRTSQSVLNGLNSAYNNEIEWLYSILKTIYEKNQNSSTICIELKKTIDSLQYKQPPNPFLPPIVR